MRIARLAILLALAGCTTGPTRTPTPKPKASGATAVAVAATPELTAAIAVAVAGKPTRTVPQDGTPVTISGGIRLLSNNSAGIISNNGAGLINNQSGQILADNGGSILANNGGGLIGKTKFGLLQATAVAELGLTGAVVTVRDATGRVLVDAQGAPIAAISDGAGRYQLTAVLPPGNLVLAAPLFPGGGHPAAGGELAGMLVRGEAAQDLDTASSLGASYVLGNFVKGNQATFDKLPAAEAARLRTDLAAAQGTLTSAPRYAAAELVALTDDLARQSPPVAKALDDIRALLVGQANLGTGRMATEVGLGGPQQVLFDRKGRLLIVESVLGRARMVLADGTAAFYADHLRGEVRRNFPGVQDLREARDGTVYLAARGTVYRIGTDQVVTAYATDAEPMAIGVAFGGQSKSPFGTAIALAADGTLYVGETRLTGDRMPRVLAVAPGQPAKPVAGPWEKLGVVLGLEVLPDGTLYVLHRAADTSIATLFRQAPGSPALAIAADLEVGDAHGLRLAPDGALVVCEDFGKRVTAVSPDGTRRILAGAGGPEATRDLGSPAGTAFGPDGTLYIADFAANVVRALAPDGRWTRAAGALPGNGSDDLTSWPISGPSGAAVAQDGALILAETGNSLLKRFDGRALTPFGGGVAGFAGDGGPARDAAFSGPKGLVAVGGDLFLLDDYNKRIRRIAADGTVSTVLGAHGKPVTLKPGERVEANGYSLDNGLGIAAGREGTLYWTTTMYNQVLRFAPDGKVDLVAGKPQPPGAFPLALADDVPGRPDEQPMFVPAGIATDPTATDGALYIAEVGGFRIRKLHDPGTPAARMETVAGVDLKRLFAQPAGDAPDAPGTAALDASLIAPVGLCFDKAGNMYVGEAGTINLGLLGASASDNVTMPPNLANRHARIRKITPDGKTAIIAGPGGRFFADPDAEDALVLPAALAIDGQGRLAIMDLGANLIRLLPAGSF